MITFVAAKIQNKNKKNDIKWDYIDQFAVY